MEFTQTLLNMLCMALYCGRPCATDSKQRGAATMHLKPPLPPPHHGQLCAVAELQLHAPPAAARAACSCARRLQLRAQAACSCPQSSSTAGSAAAAALLTRTATLVCIACKTTVLKIGKDLL